MEPTATKPKPDPSNPKPKKRKPFADLTNLPNPSNPTAAAASGSGPNPAGNVPPERDAGSAACSSTPRSKDLSVFEEHISEKSVISTAYSRRKTQRRKCTGKAVLSGTASCPPIGKVRSTKKTSVVKDAQPISSSVPCQEAKKKRRLKMDDSSSSKPALPEDFVKKQRAYFAEIDAFELPEEEASASDLE